MAEKYSEADLMLVTQIAYYNFDQDMIDELTRQNGGNPPTLRAILEEDKKIYNAIFNNQIPGDINDTIYGKQCTIPANVKPGEETDYERERIAAAKRNYQAILKADRYENWTLVDYHNENSTTGLVACVLDTGNSGAIIGIRGSESDGIYTGIMDWGVSDVGLLNAHETLQQHALEGYVEDVYRRFGDTYDFWAFSGHSLGGALSFHGALTAPNGMWENIIQAHSMDGPGTSNEYLVTHADYIERMRLHPDVMQHRGWSWVGNLLLPLPCANYEWLYTRDAMNGNSFFATTHKHDTCSVTVDEKGNLVTAEKRLDWFASAAGIISKSLDVGSNAFGGNILMYNASLFALAEKFADWMKQHKEQEAEKNLQEFMSEHDLETEQQIADYLSEHTEYGTLEYLVRGALLHCRYGTHARRLNLNKCHGVHISEHPCVHAHNCKVGEGENITYYGICKAPVPPASESVDYTKDVPRDPTTGDKVGDAPGGFESGHKCTPSIVGQIWRSPYVQTRIVDNGDLDAEDRAKVKLLPNDFALLSDSEKDELLKAPDGYPAITTLSFLVCKYGGLIEPYNSGQQYENEAPLT